MTVIASTYVAGQVAVWGFIAFCCLFGIIQGARDLIRGARTVCWLATHLYEDLRSETSADGHEYLVQTCARCNHERWIPWA